MNHRIEGYRLIEMRVRLHTPEILRRIATSTDKSFRVERRGAIRFGLREDGLEAVAHYAMVHESDKMATDLREIVEKVVEEVAAEFSGSKEKARIRYLMKTVTPEFCRRATRIWRRIMMTAVPDPYQGARRLNRFGDEVDD